MDNKIFIIKKNYSLKDEGSVKERLMEISQLPCAIKLNGDFCKCFEKVPFNKIDLVKKTEYRFEFLESEENNINLDTLEFENMFDINIMRDESKFKYQVRSLDSDSKKSIFYVGKYILYTLNIYRDDLKFTKGYNNRFGIIAKESDVQRQFELLDKEFSTIGYYVPLQIEIGGKFTFNADNFIQNQISKSSLKSNANIDLKFIKNNINFFNLTKEDLYHMFSSTQKILRGGDIFVENFEQWKKTVNLENAVVVGYKNLQKIETLIREDFSSQLKGALQLLDDKYNARKEYYTICEDLKRIKSNNKNLGRRNGSYQEGFCHTKNVPKIDVIKYECSETGRMFQKVRNEYNNSFENIIVGWKIEDVWKDGTNGDWEINSPLLSHEINVKFISQTFRGERFNLEVYVMEIPK